MLNFLRINSRLIILQFLVIACLTFMHVAFYLAYLLIISFEIFIKSKYTTEIKKNLILYFSLLLLCMLFGIYNAISYPSNLVYIALVLTTFLSANIFVNDMQKYKDVSQYILVFFQFTILVAVVFKTGFSVTWYESPMENLVEGMSANGLSTMLIIIQINYFISKYLTENKVPILTCILTLVIAIIGYGRGSILSAFLLLIVAIIFFIDFNKNKHLVFIYLPAIFGLIIIIILSYDNIFSYFYSNTKLSAGLVEYHREKILSEYINKIDRITLFFGADYPASVKTDYNFNPHNSFLRAHHMYGLFYLLLMLITPLYVLMRLPRVKEKILIGLLYIILLFRAFTEPILFPTIFDFFYFASFFVLPKIYIKHYKNSQISLNITNATSRKYVFK